MWTAIASDFKTLLTQNHWDISEVQQAQMIAYLELIHKWNKVYNLTAIREPHKMLTHHLIDSLSIQEFITAERYADVGTGAGLPGIVLAILFPKKQFTLIDTVAKKTRFLTQVKTELQLDNIEVVNARVENYQPDVLFDGVITRAFSDLAKMVSLTQHLLKPNGRWLAMKGVQPDSEMAELPNTVSTTAIHALTISGLSDQRHLIVLSQGMWAELEGTGRRSPA